MEKEKKLGKLLRSSKKTVSMEKSEKELIRSNIVQFMKDHPFSAMEEARIPFYGVLASFFESAKNLLVSRTLHYGFALSCLAIFLGSISFAAQHSLPGDSLYPIKTQVNEEVLSWVSFSNEAKAAYNVKLVQRRLEEIEQVAARGKLNSETNEQAASLLKKQIAKAGEHAGKAAQKKPALPVTVQSELEASLFAHGFVLETLADRHERDEVSNNIRKATAEVKEKIREVKKAREEGETRIASKPAEEIKSSADINMQKARESMLEVKQSLNDKRKALTVRNYEKAIRNLLEAEKALSLSEKDLEAGKYGEAFVSSQKVIRAVQETNIGVASSLELDVDVPEGTSITEGEEQDETEGDASEDKEQVQEGLDL